MHYHIWLCGVTQFWAGWKKFVGRLKNKALWVKTSVKETCVVFENTTCCGGVSSVCFLFFFFQGVLLRQIELLFYTQNTSVSKVIFYPQWLHPTHSIIHIYLVWIFINLAGHGSSVWLATSPTLSLNNRGGLPGFIEWYTTSIIY